VTGSNSGLERLLNLHDRHVYPSEILAKVHPALDSTEIGFQRVINALNDIGYLGTLA